jgi:hypothetical protein
MPDIRTSVFIGINKKICYIKEKDTRIKRSEACFRERNENG